jgi:anti-sigma regulatory factor (Ser/Thr protein kinase)
MPESLSRTLPGLPSSVRQARIELRDFLDGYGRVDDAQLVLSELATNAVLHSRSRQDGGEIEVRFEYSPGVVRIEVVDQGDEPARDGDQPEQAEQIEAFAPAEDPAFPHGESGRGLKLVDALADKWGCDSSPGGPATWWAELWTEESTNV